MESLLAWTETTGLGERVAPWMLQVGAVVFLTLLAGLVVSVLLGRVVRRLERTRNLYDDAVVGALVLPLRMLIYLQGLSVAVQIAAAQGESALFDLIGPLRSLGVVMLLGWFLIRAIGRVEAKILDPKIPAGEDVDRTTLSAVTKLLRATVFVTVALIALQTFGISVSGVLAFGGVGGIAIGFAARDLLANFFGGLMIYLDKPFRVGEWVRSPDREIEGTVERIGWRMSVIRTFDKRPLYVPNSIFNTIAIETPTRMTHRRIHETIGVRYLDVAQLPAILEEVEAYLRGSEDIDATQTLMVNFNRFGASSLDFFIYTFTRTTVWTEYHKVKQRVLLRISEIIAAHGAEVAFPTTTVHLFNEQPDPAAAEPAGEAAASDADPAPQPHDARAGAASGPA